MFPYFETLIEHLSRGDTAVQQAFGEHVHWGYWKNPNTAAIDPRAFHQAAEAMLDRMVALAAIRNGTTILDAGCGFGGTINFLNHRHDACVLVGINIDQQQLDIARQRVAPHRNNAVHFIPTNACALPFRSKSFDTVLAVESIFHFPDRRRFISESARVLKPGGLLIISDFVPLAHLGRLLDLAERSTHLIGQMYGKVNADISRSRYLAAAHANGMECVAIEDITGNTLPTYRFLRNNLYRTQKKAAYDRATFLLELFSKLRLVRYLILVFRKPHAQ